MSQRRMFSKTITASSKFLKMPEKSRLLYYDLGMESDDDGYCEYYGVLAMTKATEKDLKILQINGFIIILDDDVIFIVDWKINNSIPKDRYHLSKYAGVYNLNTACIQNVNILDTEVRLGKVREEKGEASARKYSKIEDLTNGECTKIADQYGVLVKDVVRLRESLTLYCKSHGKAYKDYYATLQTWTRRELEAGKIQKFIKPLPPTTQIHHDDSFEPVSDEVRAEVSNKLKLLTSKMSL